jgi:AcrR family transcriptional regulator
MGWREEKRIKTKERIAEVAMKAFLERGYAAVTTAEIARLAEVSPATLFNYFPSKEAIFFDELPDLTVMLTSMVRGRARGTSTLSALHRFLLQNVPSVRSPASRQSRLYRRFLNENPALADYERRAFQVNEAAFVEVVRKTAGVKKAEAEAMAALAFDAFHRARASAHPRATLQRLFDLLERGFRKSEPV